MRQRKKIMFIVRAQEKGSGEGGGISICGDFENTRRL